ncbi:MAG: SMC family ATPase [Gammaproteobacteria bacterium]|nr:SMC family ATPase [Gammaproteobacteria bacterium]
MRPEALELEGFTVFREPTRVDFADADLFAFTGATGAGKSSLIDAMIFALYGSIPRLDERAVAPVISQGRRDARVRLDFALGERRYTVVRVVRRGKGASASTREARLECGDKVIAGNVRELDAEIARLIGLDFRQFTTCAVLPQGDFARFLHARPAERQKLLTQLLGFEVYAAMRQRAHAKVDIGRDRIQVVGQRLEALADINRKVEKAHEARVEALTALQNDSIEEFKKIEEIGQEVCAVSLGREKLSMQLKALRAVRIPDDVRQLASDLFAVTRAVQGAEQARALAEVELESAEASRAALGEQSELEQLQALYRSQDDLDRHLGAAKDTTEMARKKADQTDAALKAATGAASDARERLEAVRRTHAAHELRGHLVAGESCPVCGQTVANTPEGEELAALADVENVEQHAIARRDAADKKHQQSAQKLAAAVALERRVAKSFKEASEHLKEAPPLAEIEEQLDQIADADQAQRRAKQRQEDSYQTLIDAQRDRQDITERERAAWTAYHSARNAVPDLSPPSPPKEDLTDSWMELQKWATHTIPELSGKDENLRKEVEQLDRDLESRRARLAARFEDQGVTFDNEPVRNLLKAVTQSNVELEEVRRKRKEKKHLRAEVRTTQSEVNVAETLWRHLHATGFERWLMHEAFGRLASGASDLLLELSNGQYAFRHDERLEFEVIDHANAGEARSARTLSGGETFLASLSLALALADEVADFATEGSAQLESIFLDEGFGTLDPDALDVVATAIEELGARGRMVGVVTHVADLAQRVPVQFKVSKASGSATVERVET